MNRRLRARWGGRVDGEVASGGEVGGTGEGYQLDADVIITEIAMVM